MKLLNSNLGIVTLALLALIGVGIFTQNKTQSANRANAGKDAIARLNAKLAEEPEKEPDDHNAIAFKRLLLRTNVA